MFGGGSTRALPGSGLAADGIDDLGHGSHVAGTVGGRRTGVAPGVAIRCIKVLNRRGKGHTSAVAAAFEEVAAAKAADPVRPMVLQASMSWTGTSLDAATERLAAVGVVPVVSAGNTGGDSCERTPARSPYAITVANSDIDDTLYRSSSRGPCVNMIAPGHKVLSVDHRGGLKSMTGTSMAAPHVSGVVALTLAEHPNGGALRVEEVKALLAAGAPVVAGWPLGWAKSACAAAPSTPSPSPSPAPSPSPLPSPAVPSPSAPAATAAPAAPNNPWGTPPWLVGWPAAPVATAAARWPSPPTVVGAH